MALSDLRVVEIARGVSASYTTKLLADLGADVIKIESPAGDPTRTFGPFPGGRVDPETSGLFVYLNTNKRSVVLDLDSAADRARVARILDRVDLLVHDVRPAALPTYGLEPDRVVRGRPRLVATSISPFGLSGPYCDYAAHDLNLWCAGGVASLNGGGPGTDDMPPLRAFGQQASFQAGLNAAVASLGAIYAREASGAGQHVEVSVHECLVTILEASFSWWTYRGLTASRLGRKTIQPVDFFACTDGWVFLCMVEEHQWRTFVDIVGNPEWAGFEIFSDRFQRGANWDALKPLIAEWMADKSVREVYELLQKRRVPIAPVSTIGDLLSSPHLAARGFFATWAQPGLGTVRLPGAPYVLSRTPWRLRRPAPALGQHTSEVFHELGATA
jgi:crotonobetainyl-CoA:carnitine CoA-transferase CaiB-like acyl-CoA transferase